MNIACKNILLCGLWGLLLLPIAQPLAGGIEPQPAAELASSAYNLLKTNCYSCHGVKQAVPNFNILDQADLLRVPKDSEKNAYIVPGTPAKSFV